MRFLIAIWLVCIASLASAQNLPLLGAGGGPAALGGLAPVIGTQTFALSLPTTANHAVGTVVVSNTATGCLIEPATDPQSHYAISPSGGNCALRVSAAGASQMTTTGQDNLTVKATNAFGQGSATIHVSKTAVVSADDGFDGRSTCAAGPNEPNLLNSYAAHRPPWRVAGVDYCVGVSDGMLDKDPLDLPPHGNDGSGTCPDNAAICRADGTNTVILRGPMTVEGYDFSLHQGWQLYIYSGATGSIIQNNYWKMSSPGEWDPLVTKTNPANITIRHNTFDFNHIHTPANNQLTFIVDGGTATFEYNYLLNAVGDFFEQGGTNSHYIVRYNLMHNAGTQPTNRNVDTHGDWMGVPGGGATVTAITIDYNTMVNDDLTGFPQGFTLECGPVNQGQGNWFQGSTLIRNNIMMNGQGQSYFVNGHSNMQINISNNYIDSTHSGPPDGPNGYVSGWQAGFAIGDPAGSCTGGPPVITGNINMKTGATYANVAHHPEQ